MGGHENYAPCALADLINKGYDYWALGHVHRANVLNTRPYVVFSRKLAGPTHTRDGAPRGASVVTVDNGEVVDFDTLYSDVVRWTVVTVNVVNSRSVGDVLDRIRDAVENEVSSRAEGRLLACRILLQGRTEIHGRLLVDADHLLSEARSIALGLGDDASWIEKVVVATKPAISPDVMEKREDAVGELLRMFRGAGSDTELLRQLDNDIGEMARRLPAGSAIIRRGCSVESRDRPRPCGSYYRGDAISFRAASGRTGLNCG